MDPSARDRLIAATIELFRVSGFNGTGLKAVTVKSGLPTGSLYHHFKGGKDELAEAALSEAGRAYLGLLELIWDEAGTPEAAVSAFFDGAALALEQADFIDICPVGSVARETASSNERLRVASQRIFESWRDEAQRRLVAAGLPADQASALSWTLIAAIEGGFMLSRTGRDATVLREIGANMTVLVERAVASATSR